MGKMERYFDAPDEFIPERFQDIKEKYEFLFFLKQSYYVLYS